MTQPRMASLSRKPKLKSFLAMEMNDRAAEMRSKGRDVISFSLGEPDFKSPDVVKKACIAAIRQDDTKYGHSQGSLELREEIVRHYRKKYSVSVSPEQIFVTNGTSPALFMTFSALLERDDEVILSTPHYPADTNFIEFASGKVVFHQVKEEENYQWNLKRLRKQIHRKTKAFLTTSPSNPTGALVADDVYRFMAKSGKYIVADEIYHGLTYTQKERSALNFTDRCFVINGFSKAYAMTGYRLGYVIAPKDYLDDLKRLQQNFYISVTSFVQQAGVAALKYADRDVRRMNAEYKKRRDLMIEGLRRIGFTISYVPEGAFYLLVNAKHLGASSQKLAVDILENCGVAVTPGIDFGMAAEGYLRLSFAVEPKIIREGLKRLHQYIKKRVS